MKQGLRQSTLHVDHRRLNPFPCHACADLAPPSLEEQELLLRYYGSKLQAICAELKLPRKVLGTCVTFLKRMYVHSCVLEVDPQTIFLTCLYLACKVGLVFLWGVGDPGTSPVGQREEVHWCAVSAHLRRGLHVHVHH